MNTSTVVALLAGAGPTALVAKVTLILVAGCAAAALAWRAPAAGLHLIRAATLGGCILLLAVTPIAPTVGLHVAAHGAADDRPAAPAVPAAALAPAAPLRGDAAGVVNAQARSPEQSSGSWIARNGVALAVVVWLLGAAVVLVRCIAGWISIARLKRHAVPVGDQQWNDDVSFAAATARESRPVAVLTNEALSAPVAFGWRHPVILLPADAGEWTAERRRLVLVHEFAHVARGDFLSQLVANLVTAVFWFHPLVWFVAARLRADAERAADDVVLSSGTEGLTYATHLLEIAQDASGLRLVAAVGVGMVRSSRLERRFNALLDTRRSRLRLSRSASIVAALVALGVVTPVAGLRAVADAQQPVVIRQAAPPAPITTVPPGERASQIPRRQASMRPTPSSIDSVIDKAIDLPSDGRVTLDLPTGAGLIVHGWSQPRMRVHTELGGRDWRLVHVDLSREGTGARLASVFTPDAGRTSWSTEIWIEVWMPERTDLSINSAGGTIDLDHIDGRITGQTGGGEIDIRDAAGSVDLSTGGGTITVSDSRLDGRVSTGWGRISIRNVQGDLRGITPTDVVRR